MKTVQILDISTKRITGYADIHSIKKMDIVDEFEFSRTDNDNMVNNQQEDDTDLNLVPTEGFIEEQNVDNSKKFTCKQCNKVCKSVRSIKQHIKTIHKSMKRTAENKENSPRKCSKKPVEIEEAASTTDSTFAYCKDLLGDQNVDDEETFCSDIFTGIPDSDKNAFHSTAISDHDPDDLLLVEEDIGDMMMKAQLISLQMDLKKKDVLLNEKDNELAVKDIELADTKERMYTMKKELEECRRNLEVAIGKSNSNEEENRRLKERGKVFSAAVKKLKEDKVGNEAIKDGDDKVKEIRKLLKDKSKKLTESETRGRNLAQRLSELESKKEDNSNSTDEKLKKVNDKLSGQVKDRKKAENALKESESRVKELLDTMDKKTKKISELENENIRLKLINNQVKEAVEKTPKDNKVNPREKESSGAKKVKCNYDNTGKCRRNSECKDYHAKKTC